MFLIIKNDGWYVDVLDCVGRSVITLVSALDRVTLDKLTCSGRTSLDTSTNPDIALKKHQVQKLVPVRYW